MSQVIVFEAFGALLIGAARHRWNQLHHRAFAIGRAAAVPGAPDTGMIARPHETC